MGCAAARWLSRAVARCRPRPLARDVIRRACARVPRLHGARRHSLVPAFCRRARPFDSVRRVHLLARGWRRRGAVAALRDPRRIRNARRNFGAARPQHGTLSLRMREAFRTFAGVLRSLRIYYGDRARRHAMDRLYRRFLRPGDLAFDVGAHVGDRVASFRRLGARVVAVEPQPALVFTLRLLYGLDPKVMIEPVALGREIGTIELKFNPPNPTV